jgi:hypothetical protein
MAQKRAHATDDTTNVHVGDAPHAPAKTLAIVPCSPPVDEPSPAFYADQRAQSPESRHADKLYYQESIKEAFFGCWYTPLSRSLHTPPSLDAMRAAYRGDLQELQQCLDSREGEIDPDIILSAAKNGQTEVIQFLLDRGVAMTTGLATAAAAEGQLQTLMFLLGKKCPFSASAIERASRNSHAAVVRRLLQMGASPTTIALKGAVEAGALDIMRLLREAGADFHSDVCSAAVRRFRPQRPASVHPSPWEIDSPEQQRNDWAVLEYVVGQGCIVNNDALLAAVATRNEPVFMFLMDHNAPADAGVIAQAAHQGSLSMVTRALKSGGKPDSCASDNAIRGGHEEVLRVLLSNKGPWSKHAAMYAVLGRKVELLALLLSRGFPLSVGICNLASKQGDVEMLMCARFYGCPWDENTFNFAMRSRNMRTMQYVYDNGCPMPQKDDQAHVHTSQQPRDDSSESDC